MTESERIRAFSDRITEAIEYFRSEFDLTYAAAIGVLELAKGRLMAEVMGLEDTDDECKV